MAPTMGIEKAREELVDSRRGAERCDTHPSRGRDGEWAKERKPRRKTDGQTAALALFVGFGQDGRCGHGSVDRQSRREHHQLDAAQWSHH